jgi:hypothetical protein
MESGNAAEWVVNGSADVRYLDAVVVADRANDTRGRLQRDDASGEVRHDDGSSAAARESRPVAGASGMAPTERG